MDETNNIPPKLVLIDVKQPDVRTLTNFQHEYKKVKMPIIPEQPKEHWRKGRAR